MTITRRALFTMAAAATVLPSSGYAQQISNSSPKSLASGASRLLVGGSSSFGSTTTIGVFDGEGAFLDALEIPDGVVETITTPDPSYLNVMTLSGSVHLDLVAMTATDLRLTGSESQQLLFPSVAIQGPAATGARWMITASMYFDAVFLVDNKTGEVRDITRFVQADTQPMIPASATFGRSGNLAGVWTGNNSYLVDTRDPESAKVLNGGDSTMYSTAFAMSTDEAWIGYSTYNPEDGNGQVLVQSVADGDAVAATEGTAWSSIQFMPDDDEHFLLLHDGKLERRELSDATRPGDVLGEIGAYPSEMATTTADRRRRLLSSRTREQSPLRWHLLDLDAGDIAELSDLEGLVCLPNTTWNPSPRFAAFGPSPDSATGEDQIGEVVGLDLKTGEVFPLLDDVVVNAWSGCSTSEDGAMMLLQDARTTSDAGAWVLNLESRAIEPLPAGTRGGGLAPDGQMGAVTVSANGDEETEILIFETSSPTDGVSLGSGEVSTWS